jgi:hypothetical protein
MVEVKRLFPSTPGLWATGQVAMDAGKLYGNRFGVCFTVGYTGNLSL